MAVAYSATLRRRSADRSHELCTIVSALLMFRRVVSALRYAVREEEFLNVFGAGAFLVFLGTLTYTLSEGWHVADAFYFSVSP